MSDTYAEFIKCPKCRTILEGFAPALQLYITCQRCNSTFDIRYEKRNYVLKEKKCAKH